MRAQLSNPEVAFGGTHQLLGLIEMIYDTVHNPSLWPTVMERIAVVMDGESLALYASFPGSSALEILALREMPRDVWDAYANYYSLINPIMKAAVHRLSPNATWFSEQAITNAELEHSECYADFYKPNDMHYCAGGVIPLPNLPAANLSCQRPKRKGPFDPQVDVIFQTLKPHLQRALVLHYQFGSLKAKVSGWQAALDALDHAVFGLDGKETVVMQNRVAETVAQQGDCLRIVQGKLQATDTSCDRILQGILADAVAAGSGNGLSSGGSVLLPRRSEAPPLRLAAAPFRAPFVLGQPAVAALVFVSDPTKAPRSRGVVLQALYGLTPAESKVAHLLLQGMEIREAADRLSITLETARLHVKRILAKTGVSRQAELVRLMLSLPGLP